LQNFYNFLKLKVQKISRIMEQTAEKLVEKQMKMSGKFRKN